MAVSAFQDLELADEDRGWDGDAAETRVAADYTKANEKYRDAHVWYEHRQAGRLLITGIIGGKLRAVPRG